MFPCEVKTAKEKPVLDVQEQRPRPQSLLPAAPRCSLVAPPAGQPRPTALLLPQNALGEKKKADRSKQPDPMAAGRGQVPARAPALGAPQGRAGHPAPGRCPSLPAVPRAGADRSSLLMPFLPLSACCGGLRCFGKQALPVIISGPSWEVITPA